MGSRASYGEMLRDPRWQRKKNGILNRDDYQCRFCGDRSSNLQVHHKRYASNGIPWDVPDSWLITLCDHCHEMTTKLERRAKELLSEMNVGQMTKAVAALEAVAGAAHVVIEPESAASDRAMLAGAVRATIERLEPEKMYLLALPWTREASRRVDVIDYEIGCMWDRLAETIEDDAP